MEDTVFWKLDVTLRLLLHSVFVAFDTSSMFGCCFYYCYIHRQLLMTRAASIFEFVFRFIIPCSPIYFCMLLLVFITPLISLCFAPFTSIVSLLQFSNSFLFSLYSSFLISLYFFLFIFLLLFIFSITPFHNYLFIVHFTLI